MSDPLAGVQAKIDRGFEHIKELRAEVAAFLGPVPYHIAHEIDPEPGWYSGVFCVDDLPPLRLGVIAGEALGQFRHALDHLAVQLVRVNKPKSRSLVNFPISDERARFWNPPREGANSPRRNLQRRIRPRHLAILEGLQPYHNAGPAILNGPRKPTGLSVMKWFTNVDKHELVQPAYFGPRRISVHADPNIAGWDSIYDPLSPLGDKTQLYRVRFVNETKMDVPMRLGVTLAFGPGGIWIDANRMHQFGEEVRRIVATFRRETPEFRG